MQELEHYNDSGVLVSDPVRLVALWIHDPINPSQTITQFLFGKDDRSFEMTVSSSYLNFAGREFGFTEFGEHSEHTFSVSVTIPHGNRYDSERKLLRELVLSRRTMCFRDNRGVLIYGTADSLDEEYEAHGSVFGFEVVRVHRETFEVA